MSTQNDHLILTNQRCRFRLHRQGELHEQHIPAVIDHIILLNWVNASVSLVTPKHINVGVLENYGRHRASLLVQFGNIFPFVQMDWVAFAAVKHAVDRSAPNRINIVSLVSKRVRVTMLHQTGLLLGCLIDCVIHENLARNVCETRIKTACN